VVMNRKTTSYCTNRLTVVGPATELSAFDENISLEAELGARHADILENSASRLAWQFETDTPPLEPMKRLSSRHPLLTLLLDYDQQDARIKGLAKARKGRLSHHQVSY
jgi:hypothetical protein